MNKPRNPLGKRQVLNCKVDPTTLDAIRAQAIPGRVSQSEVVDRAMMAMEIIKYCWLALQAALPYTEDGEPEDLFIIKQAMDKIATWKEQSQ